MESVTLCFRSRPQLRAFLPLNRVGWSVRCIVFGRRAPFHWGVPGSRLGSFNLLGKGRARSLREKKRNKCKVKSANCTVCTSEVACGEVKYWRLSNMVFSSSFLFASSFRCGPCAKEGIFCVFPKLKKTSKKAEALPLRVNGKCSGLGRNPYFRVGKLCLKRMRDLPCQSWVSIHKCFSSLEGERNLTATLHVLGHVSSHVRVNIGGH